MRYIIVRYDDAYQKFEIDKTYLAKVKTGDIDMIIDTEESKVFRKNGVLFGEDEYNWFEMKPYDKRYDE